MKPLPNHRLLPLFATWILTSAAQADETEKILAPVKTTATSQTDIQTRTELGALTPATPISGTTIDPQELETVRFVDSRRELLYRVPGMTMIRNIRIPDGSKSYTDKRVDGMRVNSAGNFNALEETNPSDIDHVDVITGPGSVLNSSNAYGGTINVVTRNPPATPVHKISQELGEYQLTRTDYTQGGTFENGIGYFFNVNHMNHPGWRQRSSETKTASSGKIVMRPDEKSIMTVRMEYLNDNSMAPGSISEAQFENDWQKALQTAYNQSDVTYLTPSLQYKRMLDEKTEINASLMHRTTETTGFSSTAAASNNVTQTKVSETGLQLLYRKDFNALAATLYAGLDIMQGNSNSKRYKNTYSYADSLKGLFKEGVLNSHTKSSENHASPFVHVEVSPLHALRLSAGTRFDNIEYSIDDAMPSNKDGSRKFSSAVSRFGATYDLGEKNMLWARLAQGFLAPSVGTMLGSGSSGDGTPAGAHTGQYVPQNMDLKPENSITYELGWRGKSTAVPMAYDLTLYDTRISNMVVRQNCALTEICYQRNVNAGRAQLYGLEASTLYAPFEWLDVALAYTYSSVRFTTYVTPGYDYSGNTWKGAPEHRANLRISFKLTPRWKTEIEADHISRYYRNNENQETYQRSDLFNLRMSYSNSAWTAWVHILNLFDKKYAERAWMANGVRTYDEGYRPRTLRAGVAYQF